MCAADVRKQRPGDGANGTDAADSVDKNIAALKAGFYSIVLYSQLPKGAYNLSFLQTKDDAANGLQTSLGKALNDNDISVSFNRDGKQTVATGGWPANNAPILSWHEACDGWLYVVTNTLRPKQQYTSLPKLQGKASVSTDDFMRMLDGSYATAPDNDTAADAPAPAPAPDAGGEAAGNHSTSQTDIVVSSTDGNGTVTQEQGAIPSSSSSSSGGGSSDSSTLVVAASCAGAAVALCIAAVAVVTLRKRRLRRQRLAAARPGQAALDNEDEDEDELDRDSSIRLNKAAGRPVQLRVDA
jgi:hypothetical protein